MAIMFDCARDWTYDLFLADEKAYREKVNNGDLTAKTEREKFMAFYQKAAMRFWVNWMADHDGKQYADHEWVGDAFAREVVDGDWFSDYYKDAYGQRPHLDAFFYVHVLDFPMTDDGARLFCASPIADAAEMAKQVRESF